MISQLEAVAERRGLPASLRRSHADLVAVVAAVLTCGSPTQTLANGKVHGHTSRRGPSWHAETRTLDTRELLRELTAQAAMCGAKSPDEPKGGDLVACDGHVPKGQPYCGV